MCGQPMSLMPSRRMISRTPGCVKHIPVEAGERVDPGAVVENSISSDPFVENRRPAPPRGGESASPTGLANRYRSPALLLPHR